MPRGTIHDKFESTAPASERTSETAQRATPAQPSRSGSRAAWRLGRIARGNARVAALNEPKLQLLERLLVKSHLAFEVCTQVFLAANWVHFDDGDDLPLRIAGGVG